MKTLRRSILKSAHPDTGGSHEAFLSASLFIEILDGVDWMFEGTFQQCIGRIHKDNFGHFWSRVCIDSACIGSSFTGAEFVACEGCEYKSSVSEKDETVSGLSRHGDVTFRETSTDHFFSPTSKEGYIILAADCGTFCYKFSPTAKGDKYVSSSGEEYYLTANKLLS